MQRDAYPNRNDVTGTFLCRLRDDVRGNTLMIVAGMMIPLIGFVGSGIDLSRAYMAKTRLQSACDAAVLAARKTERGTGYSTASQDVANQYFDANFGPNSFGSYAVNFASSRTTDAKIEGTAVAKLDTGVMRIFGKQTFDLEVECEAAMNISNSDIMFVLDTTGSMLETNSGDTDNRFESMKQAVRDFHNDLAASAPGGVTLRYGFVPFSETVNVGYLLKDEWMVDNWDYQSRRPDGTTNSTKYRYYGANWTAVGPTLESYSFVTNYAATATFHPAEPATETSPAKAAYTSYHCPIPSGYSNTKTEYDKRLLSTVTAGDVTTEHYETFLTGDEYWTSLSGTTCELSVSRYNGQRYEFDWVTERYDDTDYQWYYGPVSYDVSSLGGITSGGSITARIGDLHTDVTVDWDGCIEERSTVRTTDYSSIPADAYDMQIDLVPTTDPKTQWRPRLSGLLFNRNTWEPYSSFARERSYRDFWNGNDGGSCPAAALKLQPMTSTDIDSYLESLTAGGQTYHDVGLVWGARLLSPSGLFGAENAGPQSRHLIFMTDGDIDTNPDRYDAYGWERWDRRRQMDESVAPDKGDTDDLVRDRFLALCAATRARGMTIWIVAFGTSLTPEMEACSGTGKAFQADNAGELQEALRQIGGSIAKLRLTD